MPSEDPARDGDGLAPAADGGTQAGILSIEVGMRLLAALAAWPADAPAPMLKTLAQTAGMPPAKAHRYMVSLIRSRLVERDEDTGRYQLGALARTLGIRAIQGLDVVKLVSPQLPAICAQLGFSVALSIWAPDGPTVIAVEDARGPVRYGTRIGEVMPLLASATGRVFGAWMPPEDVMAALSLPRHAQGAVPVDQAQAIFADVRETGLGVSAGGLTPSINGLSAPIFNHRAGIAAALSVLGPAAELDASPAGQVAQALLAISRDLSHAMGYRGT